MRKKKWRIKWGEMGTRRKWRWRLEKQRSSSEGL
jgi:hypothetical protein